jgi:hypothetical protein
VRRPLALFAAVAWVVSFALPSIDMAGRGVAPGFIAAIYALFTAPTVGRLVEAGGIGGTDLPFALLMAAYFPILSVANILVPLSLVPRLGLGRLHLGAAILASGVPLVPWTALWRVLDLAAGERVRLDIGYAVWLLSFWLLVLAPLIERRTKPAGGQGAR